MENPSLHLIFWMWVLVLLITNLKQICFVNPRIAISFSILILLTHFTTKSQLFTARDCVSKRLCSSPSTFHKHLENLKTWFCDRGYRQKVKIVSEKSLDELFERPNRKETGVPLFVTYHPRFHNLSAIRKKHFTYLYGKENVERVFPPAPLVSFRSGYSLRNHLVRAKVYPLIREKGTFCCGRADEQMWNLLQHKANWHFFEFCDQKCL